MALALQPVSGGSSKLNEELIAMFSRNGNINQSKFNYKRPLRSSPLLFEIIEILECTAPKKSIIETSMSSSVTSSKLNISRDGSKNVTHMMDNLRKILDGDYGQINKKISDKFDWQQNELIKSPYYEESIYYLIAYASNNDILDFFVKNNLIKQALRYAIIQKVPYEIFTQLLFVPVTRSGRLGDFMELLKQIDAHLWKNYIVAICKYLERKKALHVLYQIQLLTDDFIRASMTSIKFYLEGSGNYSELHEKARHLINAKNHLQTELESVEKGIVKDENGIQLKWDIKSINAQINLISLQIEVSKFLAKCESEGHPTLDVMPKVFMDKISLKTLLGKPHEMTQVAILLLICSPSITGAFGLVYRIIQACSLKPSKIYTTCTKFLARDINRLMEVEKLINCIKTSEDEETEQMCDELVALAVEIAYTNHQAEAKTQIDQLIKLISSKTMKIQCYINSNQLKTAFVNCATMNNLDYIKRIMKQAEITRQENIRRLCEKKLMQHQRLQQQQSMSGASSTVSSTSDISNIN
jgi:zinc finger FYVE domain-containing protein 26